MNRTWNKRNNFCILISRTYKYIYIYAYKKQIKNLSKKIL